MSAPPAPGRRGPIARWLPLVFLVGLPLVALASGASHLLSLDSLLASRAWLKAFVAADYVRAMAAAYLVYLGAVVVSVPATLILTMICGFLFGIVPGALLAVCAATTGAPWSSPSAAVPAGSCSSGSAAPGWSGSPPPSGGTPSATSPPSGCCRSFPSG
ncbi:hypothetical protein ACFQFG_04085 [Methylobacterium persicinum]